MAMTIILLPVITKYDLDRIEVSLLLIMLVLMLWFGYGEYVRRKR